LRFTKLESAGQGLFQPHSIRSARQNSKIASRKPYHQLNGNRKTPYPIPRFIKVVKRICKDFQLAIEHTTQNECERRGRSQVRYRKSLQSLKILIFTERVANVVPSFKKRRLRIQNIAPTVMTPMMWQMYVKSDLTRASQGLLTGARQHPRKFKDGRKVWLKSDSDGSYVMTVTGATCRSKSWWYTLKDSLGQPHDTAVLETKLTALNPNK
jgi:hypothetical protein